MIPESSASPADCKELTFTVPWNERYQKASELIGRLRIEPIGDQPDSHFPAARYSFVPMPHPDDPEFRVAEIEIRGDGPPIGDPESGEPMIFANALVTAHYRKMAWVVEEATTQ
jgi:hypothetical protein